MKIAVISRCSQVFPNIRGGADLTAMEYAISLAEANASVVFIGRGCLKKNIDGLRFSRINSTLLIHSKSLLLYFLKAFILVMWSTLGAVVVIRKERPDIAYTFSSFTTIILKKLFRRLPVIYTVVDPVHSHEIFRGSERGVRFVNNWILERVALHCADRVIAISEDVRRQILKLGVMDESISVLHPMPNPFLEEGDTASDSSHLLDVIQMDYVLSVGSQTGRKRFDILIQASRYFDDNLKLIIVGNGPQRRSLEVDVSAMGLSEKVIFIDGVDDNSLSNLYKHSQLYVLISDSEGMPITIVEAAFHGSPVLYFDPNLKIIENFSDSFLSFNEISPSFVAQKVNYLYSKRKKGQFDTIQYRRWAMSYFSTSDKIKLHLIAINQMFVPRADEIGQRHCRID